MTRAGEVTLIVMGMAWEIQEVRPHEDEMPYRRSDDVLNAPRIRKSRLSSVESSLANECLVTLDRAAGKYRIGSQGCGSDR